MKLEYSRQSFEKYSGTQFNENSSIGNRVFPCGSTDGFSFVMPVSPGKHDEAKSRFSQFCLRALKRNKSNYTCEILGSHAHTMKISVS